MICPQCGKTLPDDAMFCPECGAKVDGVSNATPANVSAPTANPEVAQSSFTDASAPTQSAVSDEGPEPGRKRTTLIAVIVAVVIVVVGVGGFMLWQYPQQQAAKVKHAVVFPVTAPNYDDATCSKIPIHVAGKDSTGAKVEEDAYLDSKGQGLELPRGTYVITIVVSPLLADGTIYSLPTTTWNITVGEDLASDAVVTVPDANPIIFVVVPDMTAVTDDQINAAYQAALNSGMEQAKVDSLKGAVTTNRQNAIDQKAAADAAAAAAAAEAQRQAEEEAARLAALHYDCEYFSFDLPDSWAGFTVGKKTGTFKNNGNIFDYSIEYDVTGPTVGYDNGYPKKKYFSITLRKTSDGNQKGTDDESHKVVGTTTTSPSYSVWLRYGMFSTTEHGGANSESELSQIASSITLK